MPPFLLTRLEHHTLTRTSRRATAPQRDVLRASIVLLLHRGRGVAAVARKLGCSENTVRTWRERFREDRLHGMRDLPRPGHARVYGAEVQLCVVALACEPPSMRGLPLSRYSVTDLTREVAKEFPGDAPSRSTVGRILRKNNLRPWAVHEWKHPRDPEFGPKAARLLDLYHGKWEGEPLGPEDVVISLDEKTCIQAFRRLERTAPTVPGKPMRVQFEYQRLGVAIYLAALNLGTGRVFGDLVEANNKVTFLAFVEKLMAREPCRTARRVFLVMDNGSSHDPRTFPTVIAGRWSKVHVVYTPTHGSWLNPIEQYFGGVQRKALEPNDFPTKEAMLERVRGFESLHNRYARPVRWNWTREEMLEWLAHLEAESGLDLGVAKVAA